MSDILLNSTDEFSYEGRQSELIKEISEGVNIIEYNYKSQLVGYIQYDFFRKRKLFHFISTSPSFT